MPNVLLTNSGEFHVRYSAGENGSCDLRNLTVLSSTAATAFKTQALTPILLEMTRLT
jgi:hypothetical protein